MPRKSKRRRARKHRLSSSQDMSLGGDGLADVAQRAVPHMPPAHRISPPTTSTSDVFPPVSFPASTATLPSTPWQQSSPSKSSRPATTTPNYLNWNDLKAVGNGIVYETLAQRPEQARAQLGYTGEKLFTALRDVDLLRTGVIPDKVFHQVEELLGLSLPPNWLDRGDDRPLLTVQHELEEVEALVSATRQSKLREVSESDLIVEVHRPLLALALRTAMQDSVCISAVYAVRRLPCDDD